MKLKYMIPALCICTCTAMPEMLHAQDDSLKKDSTERPFNAMDYVLQKRYIPQGREVNNSQPGKNFSLSVMGGVNKLRGSSSLPAWFNGGIALTKDVSSFNSYRVSLLGGFNDELKQGGIELDHLFNLSDYIGGYKSGAHISLYTVLGIIDQWIYGKRKCSFNIRSFIQWKHHSGDHTISRKFFISI